MSTIGEALAEFLDKSGLTRKVKLLERWHRIQRWKLPRCNHFITRYDDDTVRLCERVKGHPNEHCGIPDRCETPQHIDTCRCLTSTFANNVDLINERCVCGGFVLQPTQAPGVA